jgi:putative membrane protein
MAGRMSHAASEPSTNDRPFWLINGIVSVIALAVLGYLLLVRHGSGGATSTLAFMPAVNAAFNGTSAVLLVLGVHAIKNKRMARHRAFMLAAFASSTFFLVGYLGYHYVHGDSKYAGHGPLRVAYMLLLASHVVLSIPVVPMCLAAFYFAMKQRFAVHKRITRVLFPIWLYVSVTGVLVFLMLRSANG